MGEPFSFAIAGSTIFPMNGNSIGMNLNGSPNLINVLTIRMSPSDSPIGMNLNGSPIGMHLNGSPIGMDLNGSPIGINGILILMNCNEGNSNFNEL
ncbi:hypothetical protein CDAR_189341 [Caerostris darwini]|uniref:Uncharacterized protein n=1 Tax=Caerostris darwini TaxID=1538125 RepID=A0AAV4PQB8_9ARAC|nr:hypothetical protein CDAR_189341 [Caerostris darwini]